MSILFTGLTHGLICDLSDNMYPSRMYGHQRGESSFPEVYNHSYGIVLDGKLTLKNSYGSDFTLTKGMYFSSNGNTQLSGNASAVVFQRIGYRGLFQIGGPVEENGRLCYIDHCRSSILAAPARMGDPVLNLLTFPPKIEQTKHIHPTLRLGVVLAGDGVCLSGNDQKTPLNPGSVFHLPDGSPHCFHSGKSGLIVIAYHPDSDVGPTDASHPMLSRTFTKF